MIDMLKSTADTKRATCAMIVTASEKLLQLYLIFRDELSGKIVAHKFPNFFAEEFTAVKKCMDG